MGRSQILKIAGELRKNYFMQIHNYNKGAYSVFGQKVKYSKFVIGSDMASQTNAPNR